MSAKEEADKLRSEAKKLFLDLFHLRKPDIERIVDCIIGAAVLEVAAIQQAAQQSVHPTLPPSGENPATWVIDPNNIVPPAISG